MAFALSNLHSFSLPPLSSDNKRPNISHVGVPFNGVFLSPSKLAAKAMASEGKESLDHLQRASKAKNLQQIPNKSRIVQSPPLGLWDRFPTARTVQQMMDTMERIMEDPLAYTAVPVPSSDEVGSGGYRRGRTPWEIKEGKEEYKMRFDMPGMTKNDVRVWVEENMLVIRAEKQADKEAAEQADQGGAEEWPAKSFGKYSTRIALPEKVEVEKIAAEVKDGVLYVTIPKASASSRVVDINVQ